MLAISILSIAVLILVISGVILAFSKKDNLYINKNQKAEVEFETKYDEVKYMYEKGLITNEEYEKQMKNIIN